MGETSDMNMGSENFGNGAAKADDRFTSSLSGYRPSARRDSRDNRDNPALSMDGQPDDTHPRNGGMPSIDRINASLDNAPPIASSLTAPKLVEPSMGELGGLGDSMFPDDSWLDSAAGTLADHPLLRGLILELPPKGSNPSREWLDRWFEAARAILELLYYQDPIGRP